MEKERIIISCERCKKEFEYYFSGVGKKPIYCDECKPIVKKEYQKEWNRKNYEEKKKKKVEEVKETGYIIDTTKKKAEDTFMNYTTMTLNLLGELDTIRVKMCNLTIELSEYQSNYDKKDQEFIHKIESNNFESGEEALKFINDWHIDRASRRNVKGLIKLLRDTIGTIPEKNKFTAINNIANYELKKK